MISVVLICLERDDAKFFEGEAKFELYLQQYPLIESPSDRHHHDRENFQSIESLLRSVQSFQSSALLAKLSYAQGNEENCLELIRSALNSMPLDDEDQQPTRSSLLLAEIYSLQGILLEKHSANLLDIIQSFDRSCKLSQLFYSAMEKAKHLNHDNLDIENSLIEIAYQRLPLLHASNKSVVSLRFSSLLILSL